MNKIALRISMVFCIFITSIFMINDIIVRKEIDREIKILAGQSMDEEKDLSVGIRGEPARAVFSSSKTENKVVVTYNGKQQTFRDLNRSRIVGEFIGKNSKEVVGGLFDSLFNKQ